MRASVLSAAARVGRGRAGARPLLRRMRGAPAAAPFVRAAFESPSPPPPLPVPFYLHPVRPESPEGGGVASPGLASSSSSEAAAAALDASASPESPLLPSLSLQEFRGLIQRKSVIINQMSDRTLSEEGVLKLAEELYQSECPLTNSDLETLLYRLHSFHLWDLIEKFHKTLSLFQCSSTMVIYKIILECLAMKRRVSDVLKLYSNGKNSYYYIDIPACGIIFNMFISMNDSSSLYSFLSSCLKTQGFKGNLFQTSELTSEFINCLCRNQRYSWVIEQFLQFDRRGYQLTSHAQSHVILSLLHERGDERNVWSAWILFNSMMESKAYPSRDAFFGIMQAMERGALTASLQKRLGELERMVGSARREDYLFDISAFQRQTSLSILTKGLSTESIVLNSVSDSYSESVFLDDFPASVCPTIFRYCLQRCAKKRAAGGASAVSDVRFVVRTSRGAENLRSIERYVTEGSMHLGYSLVGQELLLGRESLLRFLQEAQEAALEGIL